MARAWGAGSAWRSVFFVGGEGEAVESDEVGGDHEVGKGGAEVFAEVGGVNGTIARDEVGDEALSPGVSSRAVTTAERMAGGC